MGKSIEALIAAGILMFSIMYAQRNAVQQIQVQRLFEQMDFQSETETWAISNIDCTLSMDTARYNGACDGVQSIATFLNPLPIPNPPPQEKFTDVNQGVYFGLDGSRVDPSKPAARELMAFCKPGYIEFRYRYALEGKANLPNSNEAKWGPWSDPYDETPGRSVVDGKYRGKLRVAQTQVIRCPSCQEGVLSFEKLLFDSNGDEVVDLEEGPLQANAECNNNLYPSQVKRYYLDDPDIRKTIQDGWGITFYTEEYQVDGPEMMPDNNDPSLIAGRKTHKLEIFQYNRNSTARGAFQCRTEIQPPAYNGVTGKPFDASVTTAGRADLGNFFIGSNFVDEHVDRITQCSPSSPKNKKTGNTLIHPTEVDDDKSYSWQKDFIYYTKKVHSKGNGKWGTPDTHTLYSEIKFWVKFNVPSPKASFYLSDLDNEEGWTIRAYYDKNTLVDEISVWQGKEARAFDCLGFYVKIDPNREPRSPKVNPNLAAHQKYITWLVFEGQNKRDWDIGKGQSLFGSGFDNFSTRTFCPAGG